MTTDLRAERIAFGLTQAAAAEIACVSISAWEKFESGARQPKPATVRLFHLSLQFARELAEKLRIEQGTIDGDLDEWIANRTYPREVLVLAATGNVAALAKVREEAGLPVLA